MRLLLDAHISAPVVGEALREAGHDVLALDEHRELDGLADPDVLDLAADESRVLVTFNARDFVPILRVWAEAGRTHVGCIVVYGIGHGDFGRLLRGLEHVLAQRPDPAMWRDACLVLPRRRDRSTDDVARRLAAVGRAYEYRFPVPDSADEMNEEIARGYLDNAYEPPR